MENHNQNNNSNQYNEQQQSYQSQGAAGQYTNNQNAYPAQKIKKPIYKKWWFWLIIVVVVVIIAGSAFSGNSENNEASTQPITQSESQSGEQSSSDDTNITSPIEAGTSVSVDGLEISYISCDPDYTDYEEYAAPADGNKIIRAEFEFKNISDADCSLAYFDCYADGAKCDEYYYTDDYASPALETISPGRTFHSVVYFEVPENSENIEMEMKTSILAEDKIIFTVK